MTIKELSKVQLFPHLNNDEVTGIRGFQLCSYLIAYEGWRRGLTLRWYQDESEECKLHRLNSSTHGKFFSLSSSERTHYFFRSRGDKVSNKTVSICQNKEKTKALLAKRNVPVPVGSEIKVESDGDIISFANKIGYPIVLKPVSGSMGKGVFTNIKDETELREVIQHFRSQYKYKKCLVERYYPGNEYRIYVVGDKVISAINRVPANVTGDGKSTIKELISKKNEHRKSNPYLAIKPIKIDYEVQKRLDALGFDENSIPKRGNTIYLRGMSNLSAGGDPIDATSELSEEVKQIAVSALKALPSIPHAGVDIIVDDTKKNGVVLEINATAEIGFHPFPLRGEPKDVPAAIIDYYFPETIDNEKSKFYFEYHSVLEPLKTWSARFVEITKAPIGPLFGMKYIVTGKVDKVGYMSWIRRQALKKGLQGYAKKIDKDTVEVFVLYVTQKVVEDFVEQCRKGSKKSKVERVTGESLTIKNDDYFKIGFDLYTE